MVTKPRVTSSVTRAAQVTIAARTLDELTTSIHIGLSHARYRPGLLTGFLTYAGPQRSRPAT